jgi:type II secretory pathway component PulF
MSGMMAQSPPPLPGSSEGQSFWQKQLSIGISWRRFAFANSATRREAKAILFQELAVAVRNGMPLDEALGSCMRSEGNVNGTIRSENRLLGSRLLQNIVAMFYFLFISSGALILLLLVSTWAADVERVARVLATRLLPLIRAGHSLSDAMARLPQDYSAEEVATIRAGERWSNLATAMDRLGQFQYYEREIQRHWSRMAYPLWLCAMVFGLLQFITVFIVPKFKDIFDQIGIELPAATQWANSLGRFFVESGFFVLGPLLLFFFLVLILRMFMVGNRMLRNLAVLIVVGGLTILCFLLLGAYAKTDDVVTFFIGLLFSVMLAVMMGLYLLTGAEKLVLYLERRFGSWFGYIPIIGAPRQTERESRWLGALSMALDSGVDSAEAVEGAGNICGGSIGVRSRRAAELVRGGYPIGRAVLETGVLRRPYANRLNMLDGRTAYLKGLANIAEDAARESYHALNRASRVAEVLSVVMIGIIAGLFAFAMYMPLFKIPMVIGLGY